MKSVVYKGVEYDCHIIDTAGQVLYLSIGIFFYSRYLSLTYFAIGRIHADKQSICYWNTRLYTRVLYYIQKLLQPDTRCIRQDHKLLWSAQDRLRHCRFQEWFIYVVCNFTLAWSLFWPYLRRQVDSTDGERLAKENDCAWIETSAKNGTNISALHILRLFIRISVRCISS